MQQYTVVTKHIKQNQKFNSYLYFKFKKIDNRVTAVLAFTADYYEWWRRQSIN